MSLPSSFPIEVVMRVITLNLQLSRSNFLDEWQVNCDTLKCNDCPINDYTSNHRDCVDAVTRIRDRQLPALLASNPELFL